MLVNLVKNHDEILSNKIKSLNGNDSKILKKVIDEDTNSTQVNEMIEEYSKSLVTKLHSK